MSGPGEAEFRALFAQEVAERLAALEAHLLSLEQSGPDPELVRSMFREAHTIKGSAGVVGADDYRRVAHALEDIFEQLRAGAALTAGTIDTALGAVDALRRALPGVVEGHLAVPEAAELEATLRSLALTPGPVTATGPSGAPAPAAAEPVAPAEPAAPEPPAPARPDLDTARVPLARLDELVRLVGESAAAQLRIGGLLAEGLGADPAAVPEYRDLSRTLHDLQEQTMRARMVPVTTVTDMLGRVVRDAARSTGKHVVFEVRGEDTELDRGVLQQLADPLLHLVRNAVDHGLESPAERAAAGKAPGGTVRLHAMQLGSEVVLAVSDDGRGIDVDAVRREAARRGDGAGGPGDDALSLVFRSGLSTAGRVTDISGRGVGLDAVRAGAEAVRGRVEVRNDPGRGAEFRLVVPITLAVLRCLLVQAAGQRFALPLHSVLHAAAGGETVSVEGRPALWIDRQAIPVSDLGAVLGLPSGEGNGPVVMLAGLTGRHAVRVDALVGQRDVVVKALSPLLGRLDVIAGASVEPDGSIQLVLDPPGLIARAATLRRSAAPPPATGPTAAPVEGPAQATVLVVDDALTVRELERSILERAGYKVVTAADGTEALARLGEVVPDLVLTDVEMPRLDGIGLTEAIRAQAGLANLPVVILTSRASEEDRRRGLEAGADSYVVKSAFDEAALLGVVERLLGRAA